MVPEMFKRSQEQSIGLMLDGAPSHHSRETMQFLNEKFDNKIIGRDQVAWFNKGLDWPAYSPDLSVLDYYVNGQLKAKLGATGEIKNLL